MEAPLMGRVSAGGRPGVDLVSSLCWEATRLRSRAGQVVAQLECSQDPGLLQRLRRELGRLGGRRAELQRVAAQLRRELPHPDGLSLLLLEELTRRPLVASAG